jgi:hypothetical protein
MLDLNSRVTLILRSCQKGTADRTGRGADRIEPQGAPPVRIPRHTSASAAGAFRLPSLSGRRARAARFRRPCPTTWTIPRGDPRHRRPEASWLHAMRSRARLAGGPPTSRSCDGSCGPGRTTHRARRGLPHIEAREVRSNASTLPSLAWHLPLSVATRAARHPDYALGSPIRRTRIRGADSQPWAAPYGTPTGAREGLSRARKEHERVLRRIAPLTDGESFLGPPIPRRVSLPPSPPEPRPQHLG